MDRHHIAQYGLIAAILGGGGVGYHELSSRPPIVNAVHVMRASPRVWPPLTDAEVVALTAALAPVAKGKAITIYCINSNCADVADDVASALTAAGAMVRIETPMSALDGLAFDSDDADRIGDALKAATGMTPKRTPHHGETYISFGRRTD